MTRGTEEGRPFRRGFLRQVCGGAAAIATAGGAAAGEDAARPATLPSIQLGPHRVSRLISGGNPIGGHSHSSLHLRRFMLEYFTVERTAEYLEKCIGEGIDTWQFDHEDKCVAALRRVRERGHELKFICLHAGNRAPIPKVIEDMRPIAVVHHGGVTDNLFRQGKAGEVRDFVKRVKGHGLLAGVSSHSPDNIKRVADEGWENDFFMTCFYYVTRPREDQEKRLGKVIVDEPYLESDPVDMTRVIRGVPKPCLAFKILAAGRLCWNASGVEAAFRFAFSNIKKTDAVIVGMFPRFEDEVHANAEYTRKHGAS